MDVAATDSTRRRLVLVPPEKNNEAAPITPRPRYRSPTPTKTGRCPSPSLTRPTLSSISHSVAARRTVSAERKRPSTPTSPTSPFTPIDSSRRLSTGRLPESLWPSTMRSLSVSDSVSVKEKPVRSSSVDRTLRPSTNIAQKQKAETTSISRKPTPERRSTPLKGKNSASDLSENSKPVDGDHSRLIEQHRWPSRIGGTINSNSLNRSSDLGEKASRSLSTSGPSLRRMSLPLSPTKSEDNYIPRSPGAQRLGGRINPNSLNSSLDLAEKASRHLSTSGPSLRRMSLPLSSNDGQMSPTKSENNYIPRSPGAQRLGGRINPNSLNNSLDLAEKASRHLSTSGPSLRRMSLPMFSSSNPLSSNGGLVSPTKSENNYIPRSPGAQRLLSTSSLDRETLEMAVAKLHPLSTPGSRLASPSRTSSSSISRGRSASRGVSPSRGLSPVRGLSPARGLSPSRGTNSTSFARPSTAPSRGVSPSWIRATSTPTESSTTTSAFSFITDVKKGKKASYIEDVHQLRLLHNRYLQWRFVIAQAEAAMDIQRLTSEESLFNVWHAISEVQDHVTSQRIGLQQLKLEIKLNSLLNDQIVSLEDWEILERNHVSSLVGAIEDLEANTLCLPVTEGTMVDIEALKAAMSSALDIMQAMGSSIWSLFSKVEEMNKMVSELAVVVTKESSMEETCEDLLASTAIMQIEECSLKTHLIQQTSQEGEDEVETPPLLPVSKFPWP